MKFKLIVLASLAMIALVSAEIFIQQKKPVDMPRLSIGNGTHAITGLLAIAEQEGFFTDENLEVHIEPYGSGILAFNAFREGVHEMATVAETPLVLNRFEEQNVKILATIGNTDSEEKVIARKDAGILEPSDLRGKRIAVHKKGTSPHFFIYLFLLSNGIQTAEVDLRFVPVEDIVASLERGDIDAVALSEPLATQAKAALGENGVLFTSPGLYSRSYNLVTSEKFIADNPETVEGVLRALVRAEAFAKKNPARAIQDVSKGFGIDEPVLQDVWSHQRLEVSLTQAFLAMLDDQARWAIQEGLAAGPDIPNFLSAVHLNALKQVKPEAITVIR